MEGNEDIFSRVMTDKAFRNAAQEHLAREIFERVRGGDEKSSGERALASGSKG
jgi:type I restriction enzyme R subunit